MRPWEPFHSQRILSLVGSWHILITLLFTTGPLVLWKSVELCFFFLMHKPGMMVLNTMDSWSTNPFAGPSSAIPFILNFLYQRASIISLAILRAMYSDPYAYALTVFCCLFDYHLIGDPFTNTKIPFLCNLMLSRSQACMASSQKSQQTFLWLQSCFSWWSKTTLDLSCAFRYEKMHKR